MDWLSSLYQRMSFKSSPSQSNGKWELRPMAQGLRVPPQDSWESRCQNHMQNNLCIRSATPEGLSRGPQGFPEADSRWGFYCPCPRGSSGILEGWESCPSLQVTNVDSLFPWTLWLCSRNFRPPKEESPNSLNITEPEGKAGSPINCSSHKRLTMHSPLRLIQLHLHILKQMAAIRTKINAWRR